MESQKNSELKYSVEQMAKYIAITMSIMKQNYEPVQLTADFLKDCRQAVINDLTLANSMEQSCKTYDDLTNDTDRDQ